MESKKKGTLWCQLEDMFQLIVTPQGIEKVKIQLKDTPTKVYAIGQACFFNVWPPSGANRFAEILSLAANSLSLAEKYFSLLRKSFNFRCKIIEYRREALEFIQISLSLAKILSLGTLEFSDKC